MSDTDGVVSWLPDLTGMPLDGLPDWDPGDATEEMLQRVDRPSAQIAGSNGS